MVLLIFSCGNKTETTQNLSDGKHCFALKDEVNNNTLILNIEGNKVSGNIAGLIEDKANSYYSSFGGDFTGTKDGENLSVEVVITIEGDVQKTPEKWVLTGNTLKMGMRTYTKLDDCKTVEGSADGANTTSDATLTFDANSKFTWEILRSTNTSGETASIVSLIFGGKKVGVHEKVIDGEVTITERSDYKNLQIPDNALAACSGYWAGGSTIFYVVPSSAIEVTVFRTYLGEEGGKAMVDKKTQINIVDFK
jgi:hypothetical protein